MSREIKGRELDRAGRQWQLAYNRWVHGSEKEADEFAKKAIKHLRNFMRE